jgi:hypothetical protein
MDATRKTTAMRSLAAASRDADTGPSGRDDARPALIHCGRASQQTRGMPNLPFFELGEPPYDRVFVGEE